MTCQGRELRAEAKYLSEKEALLGKVVQVKYSARSERKVDWVVCDDVGYDKVDECTQTERFA